MDNVSGSAAMRPVDLIAAGPTRMEGSIGTYIPIDLGRASGESALAGDLAFVLIGEPGHPIVRGFALVADPRSPVHSRRVTGSVLLRLPFFLGDYYYMLLAIMEDATAPQPRNVDWPIDSLSQAALPEVVRTLESLGLSRLEQFRDISSIAEYLAATDENSLMAQDHEAVASCWTLTGEPVRARAALMAAIRLARREPDVGLSGEVSAQHLLRLLDASPKEAIRALESRSEAVLGMIDPRLIGGST